MKKLLLTTALCVTAVLSTNAQGTLNFLNAGQAVNLPDGTPVPGMQGFTAQLQLADGTNVGDPAPILANGLFAGGTRIIDSVAPGAEATLQVFVSNADGTIFGTSSQFMVTLGGVGNPPSTPSSITGTGGLMSFQLEVIPEPSTILLALLGGSALLFLRRRRK